MIALAETFVQNDELLFNSSPLIGRSTALRHAIRYLPEMASCQAPVLILGDTGTGKELIARAIHDLGTRAAAPFIAQNCAAIPFELAESELFGHKNGAFSGALRDKPGIVELAHRGTLFLDEIAELSTALQAKLLRVLDDGRIRRIGDVVERPVDFRLICATNRDIHREVKEGRFRSDLFHRINFFTVRLPPLSRRVEDISELAQYFLVLAAEQAERSIPEITKSAMRALCAHSWPGNVRELRNVIERAVVLARFRAIEVEHLQLAPTDRIQAMTLPVHGDQCDAPQTLHSVEGNLIREALIAHNNNLSVAATTLGISRQRLQELVKKHDLPRPQWPPR